MTDHATNLARVRQSIADCVVAFLEDRWDSIPRFHAAQLTEYVQRFHPSIAPDSPRRVMSELKKCGRIDYELVSRSESLYEVTSITQRERREPATLQTTLW